MTNPPRRQPRETWRIRWPVSSETTVTTAVLPWRAASDACVQPPARNARLTTQMRQKQSRRDRRYDYRRQDDVPPEHGTLRPCAKCCGVRRARAPWDSNPRGRVQRTLVVHTCFVEPHDGAGLGTLINSARSLSFQLRTWKMSTPGQVRNQGDE